MHIIQTIQTHTTQEEVHQDVEWLHATTTISIKNNNLALPEECRVPQLMSNREAPALMQHGSSGNYMNDVMQENEQNPHGKFSLRERLKAMSMKRSVRSLLNKHNVQLQIRIILTLVCHAHRL
jgi:hypothetical protein